MRTPRHAIALAAGALLATATSLAGPGGQPALANADPRYTITDLGTLGGSFSSPIGMNDRGEVTGVSVAPGDTALRGFVWTNGRMVDLGTLGGPQGAGSDINASGQVSGWGDLNVSAPPSLFNTDSVFCNPPMVADQPAVACHAFLWDHGKKIDLGTLGGLNSTAENQGINDEGHVVGTAETTSVDPTSPSRAPTFHAFLWKHGRMIDLGTPGGGPDSIAFSVNNRDQVVGATLADSTRFHDAVGFVWQDGRSSPLGTLGGSFSMPNAINNRGQAVGQSTIPGDASRHPFLWQRGRMTDLGLLPGDVNGGGADINDPGQVVGESCSTERCRPALWSNGRAVDLNQAIPPSSGWQLFDAQAINARGQITGDGLVNGEFHAFLLTPVH
jgi:probable HAF family extracellular repeat protein